MSKAFAVLPSPATVKLPSDFIAKLALQAGCLSRALCGAEFDVTFKTPS